MKARSSFNSRGGTRRIGIEITGFGPIGRKLAESLVMDNSLRELFQVVSVSDSSGVFFPSNSSEVLKATKWKASGKRLAQLGAEKGVRESRRLGERSDLILVDVTNSDYSKHADARKRARAALNSGRHLVYASKVALSFYFREIMQLARRKELHVGFGASICGGRNAITIARDIGQDEISSVAAVLNASTTLILSSLEEDRSLSFEEACNKAAAAGVLESDWSIDLDGIDAAAKSAILASVLFPRKKISFVNVKRAGIRDETTSALLQGLRNSGDKTKRVRLVSEIDSHGNVAVHARQVPSYSALAVEGRFNAVSLQTKSLGEIAVRNLGGGVELTSFVIVSDLRQLAAAL